MCIRDSSYADPSLRSENTNFALLVSNRFTQPFNEPYRYGKHIASLSNMLAGGVLVQRFGDLVKGVRTNEHRLGKSFTRPTLTAAVPGDLSLALPKRQPVSYTHLDVYKRQGLPKLTVREAWGSVSTRSTFFPSRAKPLSLIHI